MYRDRHQTSNRGLPPAAPSLPPAAARLSPASARLPPTPARLSPAAAGASPAATRRLPAAAGLPPAAARPSPTGTGLSPASARGPFAPAGPRDVRRLIPAPWIFVTLSGDGEFSRGMAGVPMAAHLGEELGEDVGVHRLDQITVEARLEGAAAVLGLAVAGHGDQGDLVAAQGGADAAGDLVAVEAGQADVDEGHVGVGGEGLVD